MQWIIHLKTYGILFFWPLTFLMWDYSRFWISESGTCLDYVSGTCILHQVPYLYPTSLLTVSHQLIPETLSCSMLLEWLSWFSGKIYFYYYILFISSVAFCEEKCRGLWLVIWIHWWLRDYCCSRPRLASFLGQASSLNLLIQGLPLSHSMIQLWKTDHPASKLPLGLAETFTEDSSGLASLLVHFCLLCFLFTRTTSQSTTL